MFSLPHSLCTHKISAVYLLNGRGGNRVTKSLLIGVLIAAVGVGPVLAQTDPAAPPAEQPAPPPPPPAEPAPPPAAEPAPAPAPAPAAKKKKKKKKKVVKRKVAKRAPKRAVAKAPARVSGGTRLVVDISSQSMSIYRGGKLYRTVPVSTGSGRRYCNKGKCGTAVTPRGTYRIGRRISGWRTSALGKLYNPLYFKGGYAIHGGRLPGYPASHGCVRVSMSTANWLPGIAPNGTVVVIKN